MIKNYKLIVILISLILCVLIIGWLCDTYTFLKLPLFYILFIPIVFTIAGIGFIIINNEINKPNERR